MQPKRKERIILKNKKLNLDYNRIRDLLDYDPDTGIFRWKQDRNARVKKGMVAGKIRSDGYLGLTIDNQYYFGQVIACLLHFGYVPENDIDHIDRDRLNNRIDNLRIVSRQCNIRNSGNYKNNTSGVKGVSWGKTINKWVAQIKINGKVHRLGSYVNFNNAVIARYKKEKELNWAGCESTSPAYLYLKKEGLI